MWICRRYLAVAGRTIHTYHTGDAGGGHAHGTMIIAGEKNIRHPRPILRDIRGIEHLLYRQSGNR